MSYVSLYRKFRPTTFDEVKGQEAIVTTLKNQLAAGKTGHAYLFCGTRGTGKTSVAKILARAVNCEHPGPDGPCNECETCRSILEGSSTDVIEIDAASNNGVDNIREIREEVAYRPTRGNYKVYIIDEVHMLSPGAFNALLKTLEEPPEYVIFILATTEAAKIPVTILSRCQRYDFHRISSDEIALRMQELLAAEGVAADERAVRFIARMADGSMRDALSLLERCTSANGEGELGYEKALELLGAADLSVFHRLLDGIIKGDAALCLRQVEEQAQQGKEMGQLVADFTWYLRNLLLVKSSDELADIVDASEEDLASLRAEANRIEPEDLVRCIRELSRLSGELRAATQRRILVETTMIRLCRPEMETGEEALLDRIRALEKKLAEGVPVRREAQAQDETKKEDAPAPTKSDAPSRSAKTNEETDGPQQKIEPGHEEKTVQSGPSGKKSAAAHAPGNLRKIQDQWEAIVHDTSAGARSFLEMATPVFDRDGGNRIILTTADPLHQRMLDREEIKENIRAVIRERTGQDAEISVVTSGASSEPETAGSSIKETLAASINMEIEDYTGDDSGL